MHLTVGTPTYTVKRVVYLAGKLCSELGYEPQNYTPENIRKTACAYADCNSRPQTKCFITAFRTFIKFLASQGLVRLELAAAIPTIPQWRLSSLPKYLPEADVRCIIESCDTNKPNGVRDRAILLLLSRIALRAGDIVAMRIQDIDWHKGTIKLSGKGRVECHLPLPQKVGEALLFYLESARPEVPIEKLFLCARAPWRALSGPSVVSSVELLHYPSIKPFDARTLVESAKKTGGVVTVENQNIIGGLGGAVCEVLSENCPTKVKRLGIPDQFGEVATEQYLFDKHGFGLEHIKAACREMAKID